MGGKMPYLWMLYQRYIMKGQPVLNRLSTDISNITKSSLACKYIHNSSFTQWDLVGAVLCERKPVISQNLTLLEEKYLSLIKSREEEYSYLSDHELRHKEDVKNAEKLKKGELDDIDLLAKQTAQDFEDLCLKDFNAFNPASRITKADLCNDQKSTGRKLDQSLILVIKQKLGNDLRWIFPQAIHKSGESLRHTAERGLRETCGDDLKVQFLGNAPVGFYKYKYPKAVRGNGILGAKVFFFKAQFQCGEFLLDSGAVDDYMWLVQSELKSVLQPVYYKAVQSFLITDEIPKDIEGAGKDKENIQTAVG